MTMRQAPPGRTSISQTGFVKPCGPHHCAICFGSVHAFHTRSRGASKTRVMTNSRSGGGVVGLFFSVMFLLLVLQLVQIIVQAFEALIPETAIVLHPVRDLLERSCLQPARSPLRLAAARDQTG